MKTRPCCWVWTKMRLSKSKLNIQKRIKSCGDEDNTRPMGDMQPPNLR